MCFLFVHVLYHWLTFTTSRNNLLTNNDSGREHLPHVIPFDCELWPGKVSKRFRGDIVLCLWRTLLSQQSKSLQSRSTDSTTAFDRYCHSTRQMFTDLLARVNVALLDSLGLASKDDLTIVDSNQTFFVTIVFKPKSS